MSGLDIELGRRLAWEFCKLMLPEFYANRPFLKVVADSFQYLIDDETPDEVIESIAKDRFVEKFSENPENIQASMAPRAGKSVTITLCCAWALGNWSEESILRSSHSQRLYNKFSRHLREVIQLPLYQTMFPHVKLSPDNAEVAGWSLTLSKQGAFFGSGVLGGIVGFGASMLAITDDLYKGHKEALSKATNESTLEWMESAFDSRKENDCKQYDIGTRWSNNDYLGKRIENGDYDIVIRIPALDEKDISFCEDVHTTQYYIDKRKKLERDGRDYIWHSEYQQNPIELKGLLFPKSKLKRFSKKDLNMENLIGKINFVDTADKGTDFYSSPLGYIFGTEESIDVYITRVIWSREPFKYTKPLQVEMINDEMIDYTYIETNKEGTAYLNSVDEATPGLKVQGIHQPSNVQKETRILVQAEYILNNFYFLVDDEQDEMYKGFFNNLTDYKKEGGNENDDAADSSSGLSKAVKAMFKTLLNRWKSQNKDK